MKRLALESQGEFIAIFNAIEMQIESGQPLLPVVRHLTEALLALAEGRGVDVVSLRLHENVQALLNRLPLARR